MQTVVSLGRKRKQLEMSVLNGNGGLSQQLH